MENEEIIKDYKERLQPKYHSFAKKINELIISILDINKLEAHSVTYREKSAKSFAREDQTRR